MRAAYEESKILLGREQISEVISAEETTSEERRKLQYVLDTREFSKSMGLTPGKSYTKYTNVDKDVLAWVLLASKKDSFSMYTWWYPFVGTVPYKGFFEKEDAISGANKLEKKGYETWVRASEAFSTLGWFNDPVLSTTLKHHETRIVNTVIHETFHRTVWIKGHVDFNESAANFVGLRGAIDFFLSRYEQCRQTGAECEAKLKNLELARLNLTREFKLAEVITLLYEKLDALYKSEKTSAEKLAEREDIFAALMRPVREKYPKLKILNKINNAEILQLRLYLTKLELFSNQFNACSQKWSCFVAKISELNSVITEEKGPFELLSK